MKMRRATLDGQDVEYSAEIYSANPEKAVAEIKAEAEKAANAGNVMKAAQLLTWAACFVEIRTRIFNAAMADSIMKAAVDSSSDAPFQIGPKSTSKMTREQMESVLAIGGCLRGVARSLMDMMCQSIANVTGPGIDKHVTDEFQNAMAMARAIKEHGGVENMPNAKEKAQEKGVTWH